MPFNRRDAGYWWVALFVLSLFTIRTGFWILKQSGGYGWINVSKDYAYQQFVNGHKMIHSSWDVDEVDKLDSDESTTVRNEVLHPLEEEEVTVKDVSQQPKDNFSTQTPTPTEKPFRRPRLGLKRIQREREYLDKVQEEKKKKFGDNSTLWSAINHVVYEPIFRDRFPQISVTYLEDGSVDTTSNRISFKKDDWYYQFQFYRELLGNRSSLNVTSLEGWELS